MKTLKRMGVGLATLIAIVLLGAALMPSNYQVERSIEIQRPAGEITPKLSDFSWWKHFSPWAPQDPAARYAFEGTPGTPGHAMSWYGEIVGAGKMTLLEVIPGTSIQSKIDFTRPITSVSNDTWKLEASESGATRVTWRSEGELTYPIGRLFGYFVLPQQLGADYEKGLSSLKEAIEAGL
jgi:hypothetical protein